jgi:hypothetical protein
VNKYSAGCTTQRFRCLASIAALGVFVACAASSQKPAVDAALENDKMRRESFEATLRVLDDNPEYVDEFFASALRHPKTLDRFLQNTAKGLERDSLARMTGRRLAEQPTGLTRVMVATFDQVSGNPAALEAVSLSIKERPQIAAMAMVQREDTVHATFRALMAEVVKNAEARHAFLTSVQENSTTMATVIVSDAKVTGTMLHAFGKAGVSKGKQEFSAFLKALDADDEK